MPMFVLQSAVAAQPAWTLRPTASVFVAEATDPTKSNTAIWHVDLPGSTTAAAAYLHSVETGLDEEHIALNAIEQHLDVLTTPTQASAFALPDLPVYLHQPGLRFQGQLLQAYKTTPSDHAQSYIEFAGPQINWDQVINHFHDFAQQLRHALVYYTYVETFLHGQRMAITTSTWTNTISTTWAKDITQAQQSQHLRVVRIASASRTALIRTGVVVVTGFQRLAQRISPLPILALPVVYDLIQQVRLEIQRYREQTKAIDPLKEQTGYGNQQY